MVVGADDQVETFGGKLGPSIRTQIFRFGGESNQQPRAAQARKAR